MSEASGIAYRREIEGLRAVALSGVLLYHAGFGFFHNGYLGVDAFFVISGYLIASIFLKERAQSSQKPGRQFSVSAFYERRARRIIPALLLVTGCTVPWAWAVMPPEQLAQFSDGVMAATLLVPNWHFYHATYSYFAYKSLFLPLMHTWSLGIEAQFYLIAPWLILLLASLKRRLLLAMLVLVLFVGSVLLDSGSVLWDAHMAFYALPARLWEFLAGMLLALPVMRAGQANSKGGGLLAMTGLLCLAVSFSYGFAGGDAVHEALPKYVAVAGAMLLILFASGGNVAGRLLGLAPLVWIGQLSYSAYLWHHPVYMAARLYWADPMPLWLVGLATLAVFTLSYFSWRYVEQPVRNRQRVGRKAFLWGWGMMALLLLAAGMAGKSWDPAFRVASYKRELLGQIKKDSHGSQCHLGEIGTGNLENACRYYGRTISWALIGDSQQVHIANGMANLLRPYDQGILQITYNSARLMLLLDENKPLYEAMLSRIEGDPHIHNVILGYFTVRPGANAEEQKHYLRFMQRLKAMILHLRAAGKRVFVLYPIPVFEIPAPYLIMRWKPVAMPDGREALPGISRHYYDEDKAMMVQSLQGLPWGDRLFAVMPDEALCDSRYCYAAQGGILYYFDEKHPSVSGGQRIAELIWRKYRQVKIQAGKNTGR